MITMKALVAANLGEGGAYIKRTREFPVATETRANELESHGLAHRVVAVKAMPPPQNKMEPPPANKAAHSGPLPLAGGETGAEAPPSSSPPAPPQRGRRSKRSKGMFDS